MGSPLRSMAGRCVPQHTGIPALYRALADPTRLAILQHLAAGEACVCELTALLRAQQSRLSFHLRVLREVGLVRDRREGRWVHYRLVPEAVMRARHALDALAPAASFSEPQPGCCP